MIQVQTGEIVERVIMLLALASVPILLSVIAYFFKSLLNRFNLLEEEVKKALLQNKESETRMEAMEDRILKLEKQIEDLHKKIWDYLTGKGKA